MEVERLQFRVWGGGKEDRSISFGKKKKKLQIPDSG